MPDSAAPPRFVHLHVHSEYSLLDGACRTKELVRLARKMNMPALALTDHGNLFGAIEFYSNAVDAGVKPLIGCELYLAPADRRDRETKRFGESNFHLLVLAQNLIGYGNLIKLATIGYLDGFYRKPRIDFEALREFSEGLICTSTCLGGLVPQTLLNTDRKQAGRAAERFLEIFGPERFFIELQNHGLPEQQQINPELADLADRLGVGLIATNDVHYISKDDVEPHDVLCCISTRSRVSDEDRFRLSGGQFYFKSPQEMAAALPEYPQALENTLRVAEMCNVEFDFSRRYAPTYEPPAGKSADQYLRELVYEGAARRYGDISEELRERLDYELGVIADKGFSGYFLIVWDAVRFARQQGIPVNARGSACSTAAGYCLGISAVDPLEYGLYFERFMDPERDEMPDIDIDICQERRPEVFEYVRRKYKHVAQIITFGRLKPRAAIRDVCRAMDVPLMQADRVARLVPEELKMTIDKALNREPDLRRMVEQDETVRKVIDIARRLEGLARHASVHAAGIVIGNRPLDELIPLHKQADGKEVTTQFEGPTVEKVGLLKMDFLGLKTLSQIQRTCDLVRQHHDVTLDLHNLDLTDQRVYGLLQSGQTRGVFQFESGGMRDVLMKMKPNRIEDLIAANALFRPGPMEYIDEYVARKHGKPWDTPHPVMTEVLAETYGIMVYQEQVSRLVNRLGNVPLRRAFRLAKAISKKKTGMIDAERGPFIEGALKNGLSREVAERIFSDILKFGGYAFNKAHSTGYAHVAFQTAYLKTYYPVEFMAALLTCDSGNTTKVASYIDECRRVRQPDGSTGIPIKPPDVNESDEVFTVIYPPGAAGARRDADDAASPQGRGEIRFGLAAISGVGHRAIEAIIEARKDGGRFRDILDFCERVDLAAVNRTALEALIKAGAFDSTGAMRRALIEIVDSAIEYGQRAQRDRKAGQLDMFGQFQSAAPLPPPPIPSIEWSDSEMLAYEKATLGFYVTRHPLTQYSELVRRFSTVDTAGLREMRAETRVLLGGLISKVRSVPIRHGSSAGKKMLIVTLEDFTGSVEAMLFPDRAPQLQPLLKADAVIFIDGTVDRRREEPSIRIQHIVPIERAAAELTREIVVRVPSGQAGLAPLEGVAAACREHPGPCPFFVQAQSDGWSATIRGRQGAGVQVAPHLLQSLGETVGPENVLCFGSRGPVNAAQVAVANGAAPSTN